MIDMTFSDMLKRLDEIADALDNGETSLEQSLSLFEEASCLIKRCNDTISNARLKIINISEGDEVPINE